MERLLVVGVNTVVGANIAASLAGQYRISTWSPEPGYQIANCDALDPANEPGQLIEACQPQRIIYCGPASRSSWEPGSKEQINDEMVVDAHRWASAATAAGLRLAMISSDAVFTGPWMFHDEEGPGMCGSFQSQAIRAAEAQVLENCPQALIIRTNAFGWSADPHEPGWLESILKTVETNRLVKEDHIRHATPILATDLAEIVHRACQEDLSGVYHVSGAERCSPLKFAQRLATQFNLPWLAMRTETSLSEIPAGFGEGECSLQTKKIRKDLCVAMPLLSEGLQRLAEQSENGYRESLAPRTQGKSARKAA